MSNYEPISFGKNYRKHPITGAPLLFEDGRWEPPMFEENGQEGFLEETRNSSKRVATFKSVPILSSMFEDDLHYYTTDKDRTKVLFFCRVVDYHKPTVGHGVRFTEIPDDLLKPIRVQKEVAYNPDEPRLAGLADAVFRTFVLSKVRNAATDNQQSYSAQKFWMRNLGLLLKEPSKYSVYGVTFESQQVPDKILEVWPEFGDKVDFHRFATMYGNAKTFQNKRFMVVKKL
jgi:hypothetical protein